MRQVRPAVLGDGNGGAVSRPDVSGPIPIFGSRWFNTFVFTAVPRFGNLGRNVIVAPGIQNPDVSIAKDVAINETMHVQVRVETFDFPIMRTSPSRGMLWAARPSDR